MVVLSSRSSVTGNLLMALIALSPTFIFNNGILCSAQGSETTTVQLPILHLYFQCGNENANGTDMDLNNIDWQETLRGHYESVLIDAQNLQITDFEMEDTGCTDSKERQFRISAGGSAEYEASNVATSDVSDTNNSTKTQEIAEMIDDSMGDLKTELTMACYGDNILAFRHDVIDEVDGTEEYDNGLGGRSWNGGLCVLERISITGDADLSRGAEIAIAIAVVVFVFICCGCCLSLLGVCTCCGCFNNEDDRF